LKFLLKFITAFSKALKRSFVPVFLILIGNLLLVLPLHSETLITEILRDPAGSESSLCGGGSHEFVEITNFGPESLFISKLFITDGNEADSIVPCKSILPSHENCLYGRKFLSPGQTALILDPDYRLAIDSSNCNMPIADSTVIWECGDKEIGNGLVSSDGIIIYKGSKSVIDTIIAGAYDGEEILSKPGAGKLNLTVDNAAEGVSIIPSSVLFQPLTYQNCPWISPGRCEQLTNGWAIDYHLTANSQLAATARCSVLVRPVDVLLQESISWSVLSSSGSERKMISTGPLEPSYTIQTFIADIPFDSVQYHIAVGNVKQEIDLSSIWTPALSIRISELYPRARTDLEPEWFEVVNLSGATINLKNWRFGCGDNSILLTTSPLYLKKGSYCIFTSNEALFKKRYPLVPSVVQPPHWFTLNNYRDSLMMFNIAAVAVDTIYYDATNLKEWRSGSIERIDVSKSGTGSGAWSVSQSSSPCLPNSASSWRNTPSIFIDAGPIPFSPDNDGHDDLYKITCRIPPGQTISISILSFSGKVVKTFSGPVQPEYLWDGRDSRGKLIENGPFFVVITIDGTSKKSVIRKKGVLWR
jgi:hypothetical protein